MKTTNKFKIKECLFKKKNLQIIYILKILVRTTNMVIFRKEIMIFLVIIMKIQCQEKALRLFKEE